jgi:hypothetical protein
MSEMLSSHHRNQLIGSAAVSLRWVIILLRALGFFYMPLAERLLGMCLTGNTAHYDDTFFFNDRKAASVIGMFHASFVRDRLRRKFQPSGGQFQFRRK